MLFVNHISKIGMMSVSQCQKYNMIKVKDCSTEHHMIIFKTPTMPVPDSGVLMESISSQYICDNYNDCIMGEDEKHCETCSAKHSKSSLVQTKNKNCSCGKLFTNV